MFLGGAAYDGALGGTPQESVDSEDVHFGYDLFSVSVRHTLKVQLFSGK